MNVGTAFEKFQTTVNADIGQVREARRRRDLFKTGFEAEPDVEEVIPSGSVARGTQHDPIHDVDTIIVFKAEDHPEWGTAGESAEDALAHMGSRVNTLLGATNGTHAHEVRLASPRDHAVKCFLDDPADDDPFTVDAMPALRRDGMLLIPEVHSGTWVPTDPEHLIAETKAAHAQWNSFAPLVRVLKHWRHSVPTKVKSLTMEVLALECMPRYGDRPDALSRFFTSAAAYVRDQRIEDPAGVCGPIQPDLDTGVLAEHLDVAADLAAKACAAQASGEQHTAISIWGEVFGSDFPEPPDDGGGSNPGTSGGSGPAIVAPAFLAPRPVRDAPQG